MEEDQEVNGQTENGIAVNFEKSNNNETVSDAEMTPLQKMTMIGTITDESESDSKIVAERNENLNESSQLSDQMNVQSLPPDELAVNSDAVSSEFHTAVACGQISEQSGQTELSYEKNVVYDGPIKGPNSKSKNELSEHTVDVVSISGQVLSPSSDMPNYNKRDDENPTDSVNDENAYKDEVENSILTQDDIKFVGQDHVPSSIQPILEDALLKQNILECSVQEDKALEISVDVDVLAKKKEDDSSTNQSLDENSKLQADKSDTIFISKESESVEKQNEGQSTAEEEDSEIKSQKNESNADNISDETRTKESVENNKSGEKFDCHETTNSELHKKDAADNELSPEIEISSDDKATLVENEFKESNVPEESPDSESSKETDDSKQEMDRRDSKSEAGRMLTPESIGASVDLVSTDGRTDTDDLLKPASSRFSERAVSTSSFIYSGINDFPTPDYDQFIRPTPSVAGSEKDKEGRTSSKVKSAATVRGDGAKSVTFADDVSKQKTEEGDNPEVTTGAEERSEGVFQTAVSEEKLEEAANKLKSQSASSIASTDSLLVEVFGSVKVPIQKADDLLGKRANEHYEKGCHLASLGEHYSAVNCFDKAINLCPNEVRFFLMRGESYLQITDFQSAIQNFKKACVLRPENNFYYAKLAFVYYLKGQTLFDQGLFTEALEAFSRAAEMKPEIIGYHTRSIACLASLERHGECLALVNKRLETDQTNPDLFIMRARLHLLFRNTSLCFYDLKDALALDPEQEEAKKLLKELEKKAADNRDLAVRLQLQSKFKEALQKITLAIEMNPMVAEFHLFRGAIHRRLHDFSAAIDDFLLALDKTEHNEQNAIYQDAQRQLLLTYNDFAIDCFLGGHFEEAILLLNKAIKGEKREKGLYVNRGDCFFRLNELHFALADYHQALELDEMDPLIRGRIAAIHNEFGLIDYEEHSYQDAEARFTVAIKHNPKDGQFYLNRAKVRFMLENQSGARTDLLITLHINPSNDAIFSLLTRLFPGKTVSDVMKSKAAREAKLALDNAMVTASPVRLPSIRRDPEGMLGRGGNALNKNANNSSNTIMLFMTEEDFDRLMAKKKKRLNMDVKSTFFERKVLKNTAPRLRPQPPPRTYELRGGHWKNEDTKPPPGWRQFGLGITMKD